ncbi:MAG: NUDIX domain-containing protein [Nanoarchaeota archaeon]
MTKEILVIKREKLFKEGTFHGFISLKEKDFSSIIAKEYEYQLRDEKLENNAYFKQIIPYIIIVNPKTKKIFGYKRFKKMEGLHEMRLHDKFSFGLGGHIDKEETSKDIIQTSMMRELNEEVKMTNYPIPKVIGFLNDDTNQVGSVHFALVVIAETEESVEKRENDEVRDEKFYSIEEIDKMIEDPSSNIETWTKLSWNAVKEYLENV